MAKLAYNGDTGPARWSTHEFFELQQKNNVTHSVQTQKRFTYVLNKDYRILVYTMLLEKQNQRAHLSHSFLALTATNNL